MDRTFIKLKPRAKKFKYSGCIRTMHSKRISIIGLTQHGNRYKQSGSKKTLYGRYGFFSELSNFLFLKNFKVSYNNYYGFDPHGSKKHWAYYLVLDSCAASHNGLDGFAIDQTYYASVLNGKAFNNDRHGFNVITGTRYCLLQGGYASKNGGGTGVGYGYVVQNNGGYGTRDVIIRSSTSNFDHRGGFRLKEVRNVYIFNCKVFGKGVCYEISKTSNIVLKGNKCAAKRKFKLGSGASYKETNDKSTIGGGGSKPPSPSKPSKPDPKCSTGVKDSKVCCPKACGKCGGSGCGKRLKGGVCCQKTVLKYPTCSKQGPPCRLKP